MTQEQQPSEETITLTKEDFDQAQWEEIVESITPKACEIYYRPLYAKAGEVRREGHERAARVFIVLGVLSEHRLEARPYEHPFSEIRIDQSTLDALAALAEEVSDAEMRARIADVLWVHRKQFPAARLAIESYLAAANNLEDTERWSKFFIRIERAIELWSLMGGAGNSNLPDVPGYIEGKLDQYAGEDPGILSTKLMRLLQQRRLGNPAKYASLAEKAATNNPADKCPCQKPLRARAYWEVKAGWHALQGDTEGQREALIRAAETYVEEAEGHLECRPGSYGNAAWYLERAIEAYRRIGETSERRDEIYRQLLGYQANAARREPGQASSQGQIGLSNWARQAREVVKGKPLEEAVLSLARIGTATDVVQLRQFINEMAQSHQLLYYLPARRVNVEGRTIGWRESLFTGTAEEQEAAMMDETFREATRYQDAFALGVVLPAVQQIRMEHVVRFGDIVPIVTENPFVPPGHEYIYARGLYAGLIDDYVTAAHLLIPQLENSLRYILLQHDVRVMGLDAQGVQDVHLLGSLLEREELIEILGENVVVDLRGLLTERFGSNLRNRVAHGLMISEEFFSHRIVYLWWLTLHLCCMPIVSVTGMSENSEAAQPHAEPTDQSGEADQVEGAGD